MSQLALRVSGAFLIVGAALLGIALIMLSLKPLRGQPLPTGGSTVLLLASIALLASIPGMYARQSPQSGAAGLIGYVLLQAGIVVMILYGSTSVLYPSFKEALPEHPIAFLLGASMALGLLLTSIAVISAGIYPRAAGILMLAATAGFFFSFFIAELLPPVAGQLGGIFLSVALALSLAWIGLSLSGTQLPPAG